MNRIYKVVWSQVKNCYTVVSEIANSHIRGGNRSRMGVVMLAVIVLTGGLGLQSTSAEAVKVQAGKNTTVVETKDASTGDKIYTVNAADDTIVYEGEGDTKALKSTNAYNAPQGEKAIALGRDALAEGEKSISIGDDSWADAVSSIAIGDQASACYENAIAIGKNADAADVSTVAIGDNAEANSMYTISIGKDSEAYCDAAIAIGHESAVDAERAIALGAESESYVTDGVALGSYSYVYAGAGVSGYDFYEGKGSVDDSAVWKSTLGSISVGDTRFSDDLKTRQITGVAAGTEDTDVVNVAQLKQVNSKADQAVEAATKGWNISTNRGDQTQVAPGDTVDFTGDSNIGVSNNGKQVKVELSKNLTGLESVTSAKAYVTSVDASDENSVTNVAYVKSQVADASLSAGKGISITDKKIHVKLKDGEENLTVGETGLFMKKDLMGMQSISGAGGGKISFTDGNVNVNKNTFASDGRIQNVTAGTEATDAVNVAQLNSAVAAGNTDTHIKVGEYSVGTDNKVAMDVVDKTGNTIGAVTITDVAKASDVGNIGQIHQDLQNKDGSKTTVVDAVNNLDNKVGDLNYSAVTKGDITDGDSSTTAIGKLDKKLSDVAAVAGQHSSVSTTDANIQIQEGTNAAGGKDYALSLNKNQNLTSVVTGDTRMDTNGIKVGDKVTLTKEGLSAGATKITNEGLSIGEKTYVTKDGLNANGNKVTQVADGKVEKGSKDAVNGGQLYNTNQMVINNANNISSLGNALGKLDHRVNKVGAGAAALAALHPLDFDPDEKWDFAAGYGNYNGVNAAAIGAYYRPNEDTMFSVGGSFGNGENMVNAGVSVKLGQGNHVSTSKVAMAKEIKDLRKEVEALKSALLDVHAGRKWNTSKLQLFPDVSQNHWAYEQISILKANGVITGYPDGKYEGERPMTRYEFATMLFRAMEKGAVLSERMLAEFAPELERFTVDAVHTDKDGKPTVERVRIAKTKRS